MLSAAFIAAWGSVRTGSPWLGIAFAMLLGLALAGFHALMVLVVGVNQFISGIGMVIFGFGFSSFAARLTIGTTPTSVPGLPSLDLGPLAGLMCRFNVQVMCRLMCRFSDAGMPRLSTRAGGRRQKSAKARNRGR
jgi:ABC-type uncharacterized transport system permease subunit